MEHYTWHVSKFSDFIDSHTRHAKGTNFEIPNRINIKLYNNTYVSIENASFIVLLLNSLSTEFMAC